ncbi:peptide deformylase [Candidatus Hodgkinia cicadicola]
MCTPRFALACADRLIITALILSGYGINSVQLGQPVGVFVVNAVGLGQRARVLAFVCVHALMLARTYTRMHEGCLSISRTFREVSRYALISVTCIELAHARARAFKAETLLATCCQHETDHSYGRLIIDAKQPN